LIVNARDNRLEAPGGQPFESALVIHAAELNSDRLLDGKRAPRGKPSASSREASKKSGTTPR
jgi:hypothetical protein